MMRSGYQDKADPMRDRANQMLAEDGSATKMKKGGMAKKADCYAAGGVAKIRHKQSTASGKPMAAPRGRSRGC